MVRCRLVRVGASRPVHDDAVERRRLTPISRGELEAAGRSPRAISNCRRAYLPMTETRRQGLRGHRLDYPPGISGCLGTLRLPVRNISKKWPSRGEQARLHGVTRRPVYGPQIDDCDSAPATATLIAANGKISAPLRTTKRNQEHPRTTSLTRVTRLPTVLADATASARFRRFCRPTPSWSSKT